MRHLRRQFNQTLDTTEGLRKDKDRRRLADFSSDVHTALERETHHATKVAHLRRGHVVSGMVDQSGVVDLFDGGVIRQKARHGTRVRAVAIHSNAEGFHAAQQQVAVQRSRDGADGELVKPQSRREFVVVRRDKSAYDVGVPAYVLRRGVHHDVGAQGEGTLQVRRGERVIDHQASAVFARGGAQRRNRNNVQERVTRRLDPEHLRRGREGGLDRVDVT